MEVIASASLLPYAVDLKQVTRAAYTEEERPYKSIDHCGGRCSIMHTNITVSPNFKIKLIFKIKLFVNR